MATAPDVLKSGGWRKWVIGATETLDLGPGTGRAAAQTHTLYVIESGGGDISIAVHGVVPGDGLTSTNYVNLPYRVLTANPGTYTSSGTAVTGTSGLEVQMPMGMHLILTVTVTSGTATIYDLGGVG